MAATKLRKACYAAVFAALLLLVSLMLFEGTLRICAPLLPEPARSMVQEANRIRLCNTRMFDGTAILLPEAQQADVVVVGDSFPFGTYVRARDAFPAQLGRATGLRVVNLGVGSTAPPEYNRLVDVGLRYSPALVVYCVFANDFNLASVVQGQDPPAVTATAGRLARDDRLFRRETTTQMQLQTLRKRLTNLSLLLQIFKMHRQPIAKNRDQVPECVNGRCFIFAGTNFWDSQISWDDPAVRRSTETIAALIQRVGELGRQSRFSMLVTLIPSKEMVYGTSAKSGPRIYSEAHHRTYDELKARVDAMGIPCLDLTLRLREIAKSGVPLYFSMDGHFDEEGHAQVAALLAGYLAGHPTLLRRDSGISTTQIPEVRPATE